MAETKKEKTRKEPKKDSKPKNLVGTRGRVFEGFVIKKFPGRIVVEFERPIYVQKYERYFKKKTKLHARLPEGMDINEGDYVRVQETRPLSKIIHFLVLGKVVSRSAK